MANVAEISGYHRYSKRGRIWGLWGPFEGYFQGKSASFEPGMWARTRTRSRTRFILLDSTRTRTRLKKKLDSDSVEEKRLDSDSVENDIGLIFS